MKTFILVLFSGVLLSGTGFAQGRSNLTISTTGNSNLKIIYAGKKYSLPDRSQTFQNQQPGTYNLVIYQWQARPSGGDYVKVYDGNIRLAPQKHLELTVMRFGKTTWDEGDIAYDAWNENHSNPQPVTNPGDSYYNPGQQEMSAALFADVKKALANEYNEEERLNLAKVIFKNNWFSTTQIREIAQTFYNEERKLRFVKYAYDFCRDKGSFFTLTELFYSSANKKELISFLGNK